MAGWILKDINVQMKNHETFTIYGTYEVVTGILQAIKNDVQAVGIVDVAGSGFWNVDDFIKWLDKSEYVK